MEANFPVDDYLLGSVGGADGELHWSLDGFDSLASSCLGNGGLEICDVIEGVCGTEQPNSRKRARDDTHVEPKSKACREKMRREKLNERFLELSLVLEPGRPKSDKAMILNDATRLLVQLRNEVQELKEASEKLQETIKDFKAEKNELRDEKTKLKADKERLEQQIKALSMPPANFMPHPFHPAAAAAAFAAQSQAAANKAAAFPGFPGLAMWQWMPPAVVDTSEDHKLRPPVA